MTNREAAARALDRMRVMDAKRERKWGRLLLLLVGPGILVMLGENDAPSMLSYAATGSSFGIGFFIPFVLLTFAMAFVAQEMTVRLGAATQAGHAELIYWRFGRFWGNFAMVDLIFTNFLTLITEFVGIVAGAGFFGVPKWAAVSGSILLIGGAYLFRRYSSWEKIILGLALSNLVFIPVAVLAHPDWGAVGKAFLTFQPLPGGFGSGTIVLLLADIGATITPWMLFFQQGAVTDKGLSVRDLKQGRIDTVLGSLLAALAAIATIIATAPLFIHRMDASQFGAAQFAQALEPYIGHVGAALFALGILEAGLVAATTISTSSAYAFGEVSQKAHSLNRPFREAKGFYLILFAALVLAGAIVVLPGFPLETVVIIVNVLAVLTMPPAMGFLLILANDKEIMGKNANTLLLNILGIGIGAFVSFAGIIYALTVIFPGFQL